MSVAGLGVKTDLEKLVKTFGETGTVRYEVFAEIWRAMKMNKLCAGRQTEREAREFLEIVFDLTVPYWLPPFKFQTRICGLYILYGVYMTQPCQPRIKIRMTLDQWSEVVAFMEMVAEHKHLDVNFVFHKLRTLKAFHFVSTRAENYPRSTEGEGEGESDGIPENLPELNQSAVNDVINGNLLQQFALVQSQYYNVKCNLAGPGATQPERSLNILNENLVINIKEILTKFDKKREDVLSRSGTAHVEDSITETDQLGQTMNQSNTESVGNKRRRIRNKAYEKQSTPFRSPKSGKKLVIDESNSPGTGHGKSTSKGKRKGKGSPGSRKAGRKKKETETLIGENLEPGTDQSELRIGIDQDFSVGDFPGSSTTLDMPCLVIDTSYTENNSSPRKKAVKSSTKSKQLKGLKVSLKKREPSTKKKKSPVKVKDSPSKKRKVLDVKEEAVSTSSTFKKTKKNSKKK